METLNRSPQDFSISRIALHHELTTSSTASWNTQTSSNAWDAQTIVADDDDDEAEEEEGEERPTEQNARQRKILPREVSDRLEPFEAMPVKLDRFAEALVSFYLLQYPKQTYVFNQNLNPHPVYTNFAIAMNAPACFQCILARSSLYKMSAGQYGTNLEKAELETAVVEHKTNAIHRIRQLSAAKSVNKDELVASIISLGTLDMRMGSTASADVHYSAVRRLLKGIGGPLYIRDLRLKRVMCFFECIYGTVRNSYIWDKSDFAGLLERFNEYLAETWNMWKARSTPPASTSTSMNSQSEFPFPQAIFQQKSLVPITGRASRRKPTGPHSPYFGLQPLPEVVPQVRRPESSVKSADSPIVVRNPPRETGGSLARDSHAVPPLTTNQSARRTHKQQIRLPAKERARQLEKQKEKETTMQSDRVAPIDRVPPSEYPIEPADTSRSVEPTLLSVLRKPLTSGKRAYWKLSPEGALYRRLSLWNELAVDKKKPALIWDLACLFCLCAIVADYDDRDVKTLATYMSKLSKIVHDANLHVSENNSNMMWLIQTNDSTDEHIRRMWEVAAFTWVCKHLNVNVQKRLRECLFAYLSGEELQKKIVLTAFDFSYDSSMS